MAKERGAFSFQGFDSSTSILRAPVKPKKPPSEGRGHSGISQAMDRGAAFLKRAAAVSKRTPEAMVKISGGAKSKDHLKEHLAYITRNGKLEATNERGEVVMGRGAVKDVAEEWGADAASGKPPHTRNLVLSMPKGTDAEKVLRAAKTFADKTFALERPYMIALHTDKDHPHVHLTVKRRGFDGKNLNPNKADLQQWRDDFAKELRALGVEAESTPRRARGIVEKSKNQAVYHLDSRKGKIREEKPQAWADKLIDHGAANFEHKPNGKPNYYAVLEGRGGKQRTVWGVGLEEALHRAGAINGDKISLKKLGEMDVRLPDGQIVKRNAWDAQVVRQEVKKKGPAEAVQSKHPGSAVQLQKMADAVKEITGKAAPKVRPWELKIKERQAQIRGAWEQTAAALDKQGSADAKALAKQIRGFVADMPPVKTERERLLDTVKKAFEKQHDRGR